MAQTAASEAQGISAPVRFRDGVLFEIREPLGQSGPQVRARAIETRLSLLAADPAATLDSLHMVEANGASALLRAAMLAVAATAIFSLSMLLL